MITGGGHGCHTAAPTRAALGSIPAPPHPMITKDEFLARMDPHMQKLGAVPCACDYEGCEGWKLDLSIKRILEVFPDALPPLPPDVTAWLKEFDR